MEQISQCHDSSLRTVRSPRGSPDRSVLPRHGMPAPRRHDRPPRGSITRRKTFGAGGRLTYTPALANAYSRRNSTSASLRHGRALNQRHKGFESQHIVGHFAGPPYAASTSSVWNEIFIVA
jgi:hypothetical protein